MNPFLLFPLVALLAVIIGWFIYHLRRSETASPLDLITTPDTGRLSAAKIGQFLGILVSSWVVISAATGGTLTAEIFLIYLAYTAGVDLFGKYLRSKSNQPPTNEPGDTQVTPNKEGE